MTDFLTRLAERTLGLAPRVQPLLASRYAPGPPVPVFPETLGEQQALVPPPQSGPTQAPTPQSGEGALSAFESVLTRGVSATQDSSRATEVVANVSLNSEKIGGLDAQEPVPPRAVSATHAASGATETVAMTILNSQKTAGLDTREPVSPRTASTSRATSSTTGLIAPSADASPSAELLPGSQSQPVRAPSPASPQRPEGTAAADPFLAPSGTNAVVPTNQSTQHHEAPRADEPLVEEPRTTEPRTASILLSPMPQVNLETPSGRRNVVDQAVVERAARRADVVRPRPAAIAGHEEPNLSANELVPPVVRVTIGRIEVRAILPPAPPAERPAPARISPVLSLDQYLKQQSEAKR